MKLTKETTEALIQYVKKAAYSFQFGGELRSTFETIDREYARKGNMGTVHQANAAKNLSGDKSAVQDVTVPVVQPQTEAAHTYLAGVFLTGYPIFATVTSPENAEAGDMMDALNAEHSKKAGWVRNIALAMRDGLKYNIMVCEVDWCRKTTFALVKETGGKLQSKPVIWEGNSITRRDMYNTFWDTRVPPAMVHTDGEFAGYHEIMSRIKLKQFFQDLKEEFRLSGKEAFEAGQGDSQYYVPNITDKLNHDPRRVEFDWMTWAVGDQSNGGQPRIRYNNSYQVTTLYARLIPEDFNLQVPAKSTPQIWKLIFVNTNVLIYAERMTNAHNYLPMVFGSPTEDGLAYQTLSFAENQLEIQNMATSLWTIRMASARRNVGDRAIYDPEKIKTADINSANPSAKIPIRPGSYGTDIRTAFFPIPFNDQSSNSLVRDSMQIVEFGRSISGINRGQEGQFTKGNRTLEEFSTVMQNSDARLQTMAIFLEDQFFTPIKEIIKYNILQYAQPGQVYYSKTAQNLDINPQTLQDAALDFKITDGLQPSSKVADTDFLQVLMQMIMTVPQMQQQYDVGKLIAYLASLRNVPNLDAFRIGAQTALPSPGVPTANPQAQPQQVPTNAGNITPGAAGAI